MVLLLFIFFFFSYGKKIKTIWFFRLGNTNHTICPDWVCVLTTKTTWTSKVSLFDRRF